jgi:hypothetical protein
VPIPANAIDGQSYQIQIISPSGTSDGQQNNLVLTAITPRTITVATRS